jgi:hypothetical protein
MLCLLRVVKRLQKVLLSGMQRSMDSVRERPQAQLLLADLPQPGQAVRLDDQEEDDQAAEDDQLEVGRPEAG